MKTLKLFGLFALTLILSACSDIENAVEQRPIGNPDGIPFTATIGSSSRANTRNIYKDEINNTIEAEWATGEKVALIYSIGGTTYKTDATVTEVDSEGTATISATLEAEVANNTPVTIIYPATAADGTTGNVKSDLLSEQDGNIYNIDRFDVRTGSGTLKVGTTATLSENVSLTNQNAIMEFSLTDGTNPLNVTSLIIKDSSDDVICTITPTTATNKLYVVMAPTANGTTYNLEASTNGITFLYNKSITSSAAIEKSTFYQTTVAMDIDAAYATPLTFEAIVAGAQVTLTIVSGVNGTVQYSIDGGSSWTDYTSDTPITLSNVGDKVSFRGNNTKYSSYSDYRTYYSKISCSADCYIYGNIMSLISTTNFATLTELTGSETFAYLFQNNTHIRNHTEKELMLPARSLTYYCYRHMFEGCTSLTKAPELPATTLALQCYYGMFDDCTSLTTSPELPATTLAENCYAGMFNGCTSLTTAPELPAMTLVKYCYSNMFQDCTNLSTAPELPAATLAEGCYMGMFYGCTNLTTAPELPVMALATYCYNAMFDGCTNLTTAPELPATTLAEGCYMDMFWGCTNLTTAPELPATTLTDNCYTDMFCDCTSLNTVPSLPATTMTTFCYSEMFKNCTSLTTAPDLPATILAHGCYDGMFEGCSSLTSITCMATDISAERCTSNWLKNVSATGTFTKNSSMTTWTTGIDGIPSGWTVEDANE